LPTPIFAFHNGNPVFWNDSVGQIGRDINKYEGSLINIGKDKDEDKVFIKKF
jgi:hypothetical protein